MCNFFSYYCIFYYTTTITRCRDMSRHMMSSGHPQKTRHRDMSRRHLTTCLTCHMTCQEDMNFEASEDMSCRDIYNIAVFNTNGAVFKIGAVFFLRRFYKNAPFPFKTAHSYKMAQSYKTSPLHHFFSSHISTPTS